MYEKLDNFHHFIYLANFIFKNYLHTFPPLYTI